MLDTSFRLFRVSDLFTPTKKFLLTFDRDTSCTLSKVLVVAHVILVSAQDPNTSFSFLGNFYLTLGSVGRFGLGPGLDK